MSFYVILPVSAITQKYLNVSRAFDISNVRKSTDGYGVLEVSEKVAEEYFLSDRWFTKEECLKEMEKGVWQGEEAPSFLSRAASFIGMR